MGVASVRNGALEAWSLMKRQEVQVRKGHLDGEFRLGVLATILATRCWRCASYLSSALATRLQCCASYLDLSRWA